MIELQAAYQRWFLHIKIFLIYFNMILDLPKITNYKKMTSGDEKFII